MQGILLKEGKAENFSLIHERHQFSDSRSSVNLSRLIKRNPQQTGCSLMAFDCRMSEIKNLNITWTGRLTA